MILGSAMFSVHAMFVDEVFPFGMLSSYYNPNSEPLYYFPMSSWRDLVPVLTPIYFDREIGCVQMLSYLNLFHPCAHF